MHISILVFLLPFCNAVKCSGALNIAIDSVFKLPKEKIISFFTDNFPSHQVDFLNVTYSELKKHFESYYYLSEPISMAKFNRDTGDILGVGLAIDVKNFHRMYAPGGLQDVVIFFPKCYRSIIKKSRRMILVEVTVNNETQDKYDILKNIVKLGQNQLQENDVLITLDNNVTQLKSMAFEIGACPHKKMVPICDWKKELNMESEFCIFSYRIDAWMTITLQTFVEMIYFLGTLFWN